MASSTVRVLSLCSGYGGLDLAIRGALPDSHTVCYVEREVTAAAVLATRMESQALDAAPVWSDLLTFDAQSWRGAVDLVVAGFPCQPVSVAGKGLGSADPRWLWPHVLRVIKDTDCTGAFLENVPGIVGKGLEEILRGLASIGFDAEWGCLDAGAVGATHRRDRWFLLAYSNKQRQYLFGRGGLLDIKRTSQRNNTDGRRSPFPPLQDKLDGWEGPQPAVCRGADGTAGRLHRLRMLGNGVVPQQAKEALEILCERVTFAER